MHLLTCACVCGVALAQDFTWGVNANVEVYADLMQRLAKYATVA